MVADAGFKPQHIQALVARTFLNSVEDRSSDALTTRGRIDEHSFDLAIPVRHNQCSTPDCPSIESGNKKPGTVT